MANKIATVTGGSRGLGRNTAVNLARRGVDVLFTYRVNQKEAESLVREVESLGRKAAGFRLDTGNTRLFEGFVTEVSKTLQSWGCDRFDYLVNSAGNSLNAGLEETTESQFDEIFKVHVKGVYFLTQRLLPLMNNGGRIVNISGAVTRINLPGSSAYGAAKGAVEVLTRYMTKEFGPRDITANVVAPGGIETDFSGGILRDNPEVNKAHRSDHRFRTYGCAGRYRTHDRGASLRRESLGQCAKNRSVWRRGALEEMGGYMSDFLDVLSERHATEQFDPTASITRSEIEDLVQEASQAPSTFNLQHWRFVAITDRQMRAQLSATTIQPNRQRIIDASVVFVIFGDLEAHRFLSEILEQSVKAGSLARETADLWLSTANQLYGAQPQLAREEAVRSVSLAAMVLMLAARNRGFASCPIGFVPNQLREILRTSDRYTPLMMIAVGSDASDSQKLRPRLPLDRILSFDEFTEFGADEVFDATTEAV